MCKSNINIKLGVAWETEEVIWLTFNEQVKYMLISGYSGSGKTVLIHKIVKQILNEEDIKIVYVMVHGRENVCIDPNPNLTVIEGGNQKSKVDVMIKTFEKIFDKESYNMKIPMLLIIDGITDNKTFTDSLLSNIYFEKFQNIISRNMVNVIFSSQDSGKLLRFINKINERRIIEESFKLALFQDRDNLFNLFNSSLIQLQMKKNDLCFTNWGDGFYCEQTGESVKKIKLNNLF